MNWILFFVVAIAFFLLVAQYNGYLDSISFKGKKIVFSEKSKLIIAIVLIIILVLSCVYFIFFSDSDNGNTAWDNLSDDEKDWYRDNYGKGQYEQYQDAINDYRGY